MEHTTQKIIDALRQVADGQEKLNKIAETKESLAAAKMLQPMKPEDMREVVDIMNSITDGAKVIRGYWPVYYIDFINSLMIMGQLEEGLKELFVDCQLDKSLLKDMAKAVQKEIEK